MDVAERMHEVARLQAADLGNHHRKQGVRRDVERHTQEDVGTALVKLAAETALGHVELEKRVTGRQSHPVDLGRVPGRDDEAAGVRIALDLLHHVGKLVDGRSVRSRPRPPLMPVHGAQIAVFIGPLIPDAHAVVFEILDVGIASNEPEEFVDDGFQVNLFGGQQRKTVLEVEPHLVAEQAGGSGTGPVAFDHAFRFDMS